jgi:CelD/BcsL family acetyltransferase involved in cellulose biosynthesis
MSVLKDLRLERATKAQWDGELDGFPGATAFHRYEFLDSVAASLGCTFEPLVIMRGMEPAGVAPLVIRRIGPLCTINWMPFPYLGPLTPTWLLPAVLKLLAAEGRRRGAMHHQQSFVGLLPGDTGGQFNPGTARTFVVPLADRSDDALKAAMTGNGRRFISKARRAGVEICPAERSDFRLMDSWSAAIYARQGVPPKYPAGAYEQVFDRLGEDAGSHFHSAKLDGRTIAVDMTFSIARRSFAWQVAVDPAHRSAQAQALLIWYHMTAARDRGDTEFDLIGAPTAGIAEYKRNFGAQEQHYTVLSRHSLIGRARYKVGAVTP